MRARTRSRPAGNITRVLLLAAAVHLAAGCGMSTEHEAAQLTGGDPSHGRAAIRRYGCGSCHVIPGVRGADGMVGPPLDGVASRTYLAGVLQNTPDNMIRWIRDPQAIDSLTVMPNTGVTQVDARDIAGYLYTLR
jgi:cytochrome c